MGIVIKSRNVEEDELIQKVLFSMGYDWASSMLGLEPSHTLRKYRHYRDISYIHIYPDRNIIYNTSVESSEDISIEEFLNYVESGEIKSYNIGVIPAE